MNGKGQGCVKVSPTLVQDRYENQVLQFVGSLNCLCVLYHQRNVRKIQLLWVVHVFELVPLGNVNFISEA